MAVLRFFRGRLALWGGTLALLGLGLLVPAVAGWALDRLGVVPPRWTFSCLEPAFLLLTVGVLTAGFDLFVLHNAMKAPRRLDHRPLDGTRVVVGMTAYDDEASIGDAVRLFRAHPRVAGVVVVDNNCRDRTAAVAREAGAEVVAEPRQGFGWACRRALDEAAARGDVAVLVEGDGTFDAADLDKMLAYLVHFDVVMGSRTTRELNSADSQMDWLLNPFNQLVAKLLQLRFWGTRLSDVGCTFRVYRREAWLAVRDRLRTGGNAFNVDLAVVSFQAGLRMIELPLSFRARVGVSKGVGTNKWKAAKVAVAMLARIYTC
ncbi:MAG: glycosyltransferase family 2 protein [Planctomycetes bacterium]|nr:glycosyltransferase family 2 protein [Planctomycetota bacterium]